MGPCALLYRIFPEVDMEETFRILQQQDHLQNITEKDAALIVWNRNFCTLCSSHLQSMFL